MNRTSSLVLLLLAGFCWLTQGKSDDGLRFYVLGDWGGVTDAPYTTDIQLQVADEMGKHAHSFNPKFVVAVGDNFYDNGITTNEFDHRFQDTFENVYTSSSLQCRWNMVLGNHDWEGNTTAQIAYTNRSPRWYLPYYWYTTTLPIPNSNSVVQFVYYDTQLFVDHNGTDLAKQQLNWLKATLASSKAEWLFVVGHYPVYSAGSHGPTQLIIDELLPLLHQYQVDAYIGGHEHNMEHLRDDQYPIDFFISGAGKETSHKQHQYDNLPANALKFFWPKDKSVAHTTGAFMTVSVHTDHMKMQFVDDQGNELYEYSKDQKRIVFKH